MYKLPRGHRENVGLLSADGTMFAGPYSCKDYIHDAVCIKLYPTYAKMWGLYEPHPINLEASPNFDAPEFAIYCAVNKRERNGEKFGAILNQLEERMGIDGRTSIIIPESGVGEKSGPFIARAPSFWLRSPVAVSAYVTLLRLSIRMSMGESLDNFLSRMFSKTEAAYKDAGYLRVANKNGNLDGLIRRSLPCLNREGFSDYLLSQHSRGISWYHAASDGTLPMNEEGLKMLRIDGRKFELERIQYDI